MITKYLTRKEFELFLKKTIDSKFSRSEKRKLEKEINKLLGSRELVLGKTFYDVVNLAQLNLNDVCCDLFGCQKPTVLNLFRESENKINDFLSMFMKDLTLISKATGIEYNRLTKLFNGDYKNAYSNDVNNLAIAFGLKPSQLFEYFYGNGERPVVGLVPNRKEEGENKET